MFAGKTENFGRLTAEAGYSCQNRTGIRSSDSCFLRKEVRFFRLRFLRRKLFPCFQYPC